MKKLLAAALALSMGLGLAPVFAAEDTGVRVFADWKFNKDSIVNGTSIEDGSLQIRDASGNGNTLEMNVYGGSAAELVSFCDDGLLPGQGSVELKSENSDDKDARAVKGVDFTTVNGAPINKETFRNGYTIEIIYKMPDDWNNTDRWTSLLSRVGKSEQTDSEYYRDGIEASSLISVSNCKEIQFIPVNADNSNSPGSVWSVAMDKGENWYSIVLTCDGTNIRTYVNGAASFRDYEGGDMQGLYADPTDGRFRIGARVRDNTTPYRFTRGFIQEIKISEGALPREKWLVTNPEDYVGEYGSNDDFAETPEDRYNFVFLPDVQNAVEFMPDVLYKAMDWMVENKDFASISAVLGLGDNVNTRWEEPQWANVTQATDILLNGGVKLLMMPGNHDSDNKDNEDAYWYYKREYGVGSDYLKAADYVVNDSPSGISSYMKVKAGSYTYLLVAVGMYTYDEDEAWLRRLLTENASLPTILISHDLQNCSDTVPNDIKLSDKGKDIWNIVKEYDNVFMMVGGHSHGYGSETLTNNYGHDVFSVLADYQFSYNGGNALFKFAEFDEKGDKIHITTFSPYVQTLAPEERTFFDVTYMTGKGHDDTLDIDFSERFAFAAKNIKYGENIIENYGFETNADGWSYNNSGATGPVKGWERTNENAHEGSWALKQAANAGKASDQNLGTYFPIEGGKKYRLSYWEYSPEDKAAGEHRMFAAVAVTDKGALDDVSLQLDDCGGWSSWVNEKGEIKPRDPAYRKGWFERSYMFNTIDHPEAKYIMLAYTWGGENSGFLIDDFSLTEVIESSPVTIMNVTASAAENGAEVWSLIMNPVRDMYYVAAGYDANGALAGAAFKKYDGDGSIRVNGKGITSVKVFLWKDLRSMQCLCEPVGATV